MLAIARERARRLGRDVDLREGDAARLPFDDGSFDTAVCCLALCSIPDPAGESDGYPAFQRTVAELAGRIRFLLHRIATVTNVEES